jgi:sugar (pentulose or hexulose) kinase
MSESDELFVGVDSSTTACKAIAFDAHGRAVAEGRAPLTLENPEPDAWEQDAESWWRALQTALGALTLQLGSRAASVRALCVANQRETFVVTDDRGVPLHPALVWMDARCRKAVERVVGELGAAKIHRISGKPPSTTPSLYKLLFLLERVPELAAESSRVLDVHAFLTWRLTGRLATSLASADPTGLVDMMARDWSDELLGLSGLGRDNVPELVEPGATLGPLNSHVADATGLPPGVMVVAGAGDGQAAGLGAGIVEPGSAYLNLGTAIVSGVLSYDYRTDPAFRTLYAAAPGTYFLETDLKGGTFTLSWLLERLLGRPGSTSAELAELERQARALPPGADGLVLVPYWNGVMNPYWDDNATGVTLGWHGAHGPEHLYRAIIEGIAFEQRLHTQGVEQATGPIERVVLMGGGARSNLWCEILADVLSRPVERSATSEATALGAAMLAAVAAGAHPDVASAARAMSGAATRFEPGEHRALYARLYHEVYEGIYPALRASLVRLAELRVLARQPSSEKRSE